MEKRPRERAMILALASDEWGKNYGLVGTGLLTSQERKAITTVNVARSRAATKDAFRDPLMDFTWAELAVGGVGRNGIFPSPIVVGQHGGSEGRSVDAGPLMTVAGGGAIGVGSPEISNGPLADAQLICVAHGKNDARIVDLEQPVPAQTAKRNLALNAPLAESILVNVAHGAKSETESRAANSDAPLGSQHAGGGKYGTASPSCQIAAPGLSSMYGGFERGELASIVSLDAPTPAISAQGQHVAVYQPQIAEASIVSHGSEKGDGCRAHSLDVPIRTTTAGRGTGYVSTPDIAEASLVSKHYTFNENPDLDAPMPATDTRGAGYLASPQIVPQHADAPTQSTDRPIPTPVAIARIGLTQDLPPQGLPAELSPDAFIYEPHGERDTQAERVHTLDKPTLTVTPRGAGTLVQTGGVIRDIEYKPKIRIDGVIYVIDSTLRMLRNLELARAMDLIVEERGFTFRFSGSQSDVTKQIGNAVASNVMEAIARELCRDVVGIPNDVPMMDVIVGPMPIPAQGDDYGIYG